MSEEKKVTGIDQIESGFVSEPEISAVEQIEIDSYVAGAAEIENDLKAAGIEIPGAEEKRPVPVEETAIGLEEGTFAEAPELTPLEQLNVDEFVASDAEIKQDMAAAGIEVPEAEEKNPVPVAETAIGLEEGTFAEAPELTPLEQLNMDEFVASQAEIKKDMKKAGLE